IRGCACLEQENEQSEAYQACFTYCPFLQYLELHESFMGRRRLCYARLFIYQARWRFWRRNLRACIRCCPYLQFYPPGFICNSRSSLVTPVYYLLSTLLSTFSERLHTSHSSFSSSPK